MKEKYQEYCQSKKNVWSSASFRSESMRLNKLLHLIDGDAPKLWEAMADYHPNARATYWMRVSAFWNWRIENGQLTEPNPYKVFREKNPRLFRGVYKKDPCTIPFDELMVRISKEPNVAIRNKMIQVLESGMRWTESTTFDKEKGEVVGKGGLVRKIYVPEIDGPIAGPEMYSSVLRACKRIGIKGPHKLRSARLTDMAESGANMFDLMKFAGWKSPAVAQSYIEARDERVKALAERRKNQKVNGVMTVLKFFGKAVDRVAEAVK